MGSRQLLAASGQHMGQAGRLSFLSLIWIQCAFGSAFAINELGASAQGMGGAFASIANDPSAIFYNPAGIAFLSGSNLQLENIVVAGQFRFFPSQTPPGTVVPAKGYSGASHQPFIPLAALYMTHRLNDRWSFGVGLYTPFGLADNFTNFNDGDPQETKYVGRFAGSRAKLEQYWFQPTVARRLGQNHAIAIGVAVVHTHLLLEQSFLNPYDKPDDYGRRLAKDVFPQTDPDSAYRSFAHLLPEGRLRAAATANKPGFAAGYLYKHRSSGTNFGFSWRSAVVSHLDGYASFAFTNGGALVPFLPKAKTLDKEFPNQPIRGTFTTPATYVAAVSNSRILGGTLAFDARLQDFRRFKDFPINFTQTTNADGDEIGTPPERRLKFDFRNSILLHAGYARPMRASSGFLRDVTWRAGYAYDRTPVPDQSVGPLFPDSSRHSITAGLTKKLGQMDFTMFYQAMQMINRTVNVAENNYQFTNGKYSNFAHLAGLSMRFRFGGQIGGE